MFGLVVLATIPAVIIGAALHKPLSEAFGAPWIAAAFLIVNGFLLFFGDLIAGETTGRLDQLNWKGALAVGFAQCLALIPGISRSGSTIVAGVIAGLKHEESARFSFLMGTPIILAANVYEAPKLMKEGATLGPMAILSGVVAGVRRLPEPLVPDALPAQERVRGVEPVRLLLLGGGRPVPGDHPARLTIPGQEGLGRRPGRPILRKSRRDKAGRASEGEMAAIEVMSARLTREETEDLRRAIACLESASFAQRLTDAIGRPIGALSRNAPAAARNAVARVSEAALGAALKLALRTIDRKQAARPAGRAHTLAAAASGAVGGAFGLASLPVELPLSTAIVMRSIAEIAREEGEDLSAPNAALACVEVFALGGDAGETAFESGYFADPRSAREIGQRKRPLPRDPGARRRVGAGSRPAPHPGRRPVRRDRQRKGGGSGRPVLGRDRRRRGQRRLRVALPDAGARPFHCPPTRATARGEISSPSSIGGSRARSPPRPEPKGGERGMNPRTPLAAWALRSMAQIGLAASFALSGALAAGSPIPELRSAPRTHGDPPMRIRAGHQFGQGLRAQLPRMDFGRGDNHAGIGRRFREARHRPQRSTPSGSPLLARRLGARRAGDGRADPVQGPRRRSGANAVRQLPAADARLPERCRAR